MGEFYSDMAAFTASILAPTSGGGLGQGNIRLVRLVDYPPPPNPWDPPTPPQRIVTPIRGAARGVSADLVGSEVAPGVQIVATDLIVIVAPWGGEYAVGDTMEIDGKPHTIMRVDRIPAAGTVSAFRFYVRR